jgi:hypothetical protein
MAEIVWQEIVNETEKMRQMFPELRERADAEVWVMAARVLAAEVNLPHR